MKYINLIEKKEKKCLKDNFYFLSLFFADFVNNNIKIKRS